MDPRPATAPFKLTYFDSHGRGLQVRLLFHLSGTPFEDHRITRAQWKPLKAGSPWGHIPILEHGDLTLWHTTAVVLYTAQQVGLWPEDPAEAARATALCCCVEELWMLLQQFVQVKNPLKLGWVALKMLRSDLPRLCQNFERQLQGDFFHGSAPLVSDVSVFSVFSVLLAGSKPLGTSKIVARYGRFDAFLRRMEEHPAIAEYMRDNPDKKIR